MRRSYRLKAADILWSRLVLDLNRAKGVMLHTVEQVRDGGGLPGHLLRGLHLKPEVPEAGSRASVQ
jgi:hypothetical protein